MISKLPKWLSVVAWGLALVAGMVNVTGFLSFEHQAVTHLTGTTSILGAAIADGNQRIVWHCVLSIAAFVFGAVVSGAIVQDGALQMGRRYGVALCLESLLLLMAPRLLGAGRPLGIYAAACACGLQNGMVTTYSGTVVRTTHLSGMFTDVGLALGHLLRGLPVEFRRLRLSALIISGFLAGGVVGTFFYRRWGYDGLYVPAVIVAGIALVHEFWLRRQARQVR